MRNHFNRCTRTNNGASITHSSLNHTLPLMMLSCELAINDRQKMNRARTLRARKKKAMPRKHVRLGRGGGARSGKSKKEWLKDKRAAAASGPRYAMDSWVSAPAARHMNEGAGEFLHEMAADGANERGSDDISSSDDDGLSSLVEGVDTGSSAASDASLAAVRAAVPELVQLRAAGGRASSGGGGGGGSGDKKRVLRTILAREPDALVAARKTASRRPLARCVRRERELAAAAAAATDGASTVTGLASTASSSAVVVEEPTGCTYYRRVIDMPVRPSFTRGEGASVLDEYVMQRHVTPFRVAPERVHKSPFRSFSVQCGTTGGRWRHVSCCCLRPRTFALRLSADTNLTLYQYATLHTQ
jgi:hypothetical protein